MDVFSIKAANVVFKIGEKEYSLADPPFLKKIIVRKMFMDMRDKFSKGDFDVAEYSKKMFHLNKEQAKLFLPTIEDELLDNLGDSQMNALLKKLTELSESEFGAVIEKVAEK